MFESPQGPNTSGDFISCVMHHALPVSFRELAQAVRVNADRVQGAGSSSGLLQVLRNGPLQAACPGSLFFLNVIK